MNAWSASTACVVRGRRAVGWELWGHSMQEMARRPQAGHVGLLFGQHLLQADVLRFNRLASEALIPPNLLRH